jgi:hypothetical protein
MIYDHRTYTCRPGTVKKHMKLYQEFGWRLQSKHLGYPVLHAATEVGDVNSYVHIWVFKDLADRSAKRAALAADPEWQDFIKMSNDAANIISQKNMILVSAPFFESKQQPK